MKLKVILFLFGGILLGAFFYLIISFGLVRHNNKWALIGAIVCGFLAMCAFCGWAAAIYVKRLRKN